MNHSSARSATRSTGKSRTAKSAYRCGECGWQTTRWVGRCGECQAWGTVEEVGPGTTTSTGPRTQATTVSEPALPIDQVDVHAARSEPTRIEELDRVLGGGLVRGGVVLLAGEPGVGKSTLLLELAAARARDGCRALYVSGEESTAQVRTRAERTNAVHPSLLLAAETDLATVLGHIDATEPDVIILDSVQTVASGEVDGSPGGVTQVREVAAALIRVAKERGIPTLLVGHVTKDGSIAGPRVLEHLVDVVLHFEGDRHSRLRMVRAIKNRYGPSDEVGCFDLTDEGIASLADPTGLFLTRRQKPVAGSCVTATVEGKRPLLAEVQALVAESPLSTPRRANSGLDASRVAMVYAVLERRAGVRLGGRDIYAATVGGVKLTEPASDLAVALSVMSAADDYALPPHLIAIGEVGLAGDVRRVTGAGRRLGEAFRLGFTHALVPPDSGPTPPGVRVKEVSTLLEAVEAAMSLSNPVGPVTPIRPIRPDAYAPASPRPRVVPDAPDEAPGETPDEPSDDG